MEDLIKALQIFAKYTDTKYPTNCEHDVLMIMGVDRDDVTGDDEKELDKLSFRWDEDNECFSSDRFGSA